MPHAKAAIAGTWRGQRWENSFQMDAEPPQHVPMFNLPPGSSMVAVQVGRAATPLPEPIDLPHHLV